MVKRQSNLTGLLKKALPAYVFAIIYKLGRLAEDKGFAAYAVGGFVRDILLGLQNLDLDIVVEGDALSFVQPLKGKPDLDVITHQRFGTATVNLPRSFYLKKDTAQQKTHLPPKALKIDIASARQERYASAAELPIVVPGCIREDLFRRDFTINSLAVKINRNAFGQLLDFFGGQRDLAEKRIKVLHDQSFIDDPTRILRAIRFEQRYNFTIEAHTERLIKKAITAGMLKRLSRFRIGDEIILILKERRPWKALLRISRLSGLDFIHPLIKLDQVLIKQFKSAKMNIDSFKQKHTSEDLDSWLVYFMILTARLSPEKIKRLGRDFSLTKRNRQKLNSFKRYANPALKRIGQKGPLFARQIYQALSRFSYEEILVLLSLAKSKKGKNRIRLFLYKLSLVKIELKGRDLKKLGIRPGPEYKDILQKVLYAKVDGKLKSKADELNCARSILFSVQEK